MKKAITIFTCKPANIKSLTATPSAKNVAEVDIAETIELCEEEYRELVADFFKPRAYLAGKGGRNGAIRITSGNHRPLIIDPEGHNYARYAGFEITK